ncbi:Caspase activity and apoptosis inhibitor [Dirofilaria immitis]
MKKDKKWHGKKTYSFQRKKTRMRISSGASSEATCCIILSPNKQPNRCSSTVSCVSTSSSSRSSSIRKKATRNDFLSPLDSRSKEKLKSIASYIDNREVMVRYMFASLHKRELYELLPENLKKLEIAELRELCIKELNEMSAKNICTVLKGKDFTEIGSEGEKDKALIVSANVKTSKAEIAVADSTTEMITPNLTTLPGIFHAVDEDNTVMWNDTISTSKVHYATAKKNSSIMMHQKSETVNQSNFGVEQKIALLLNQHVEIFAIEKASSPKDQASANATIENDDELEDGEVVSDQEKSSKSSKNATDQNCSQCFTTYNDIFIDNAHNDLWPGLVLKNLENSGNSSDTTNKVREEKKLNMLELELRARAIKALIRRNDSKL